MTNEMTNAEKVARVERGIEQAKRLNSNHLFFDAALRDLRAWQEIVERHRARTADPRDGCNWCSTQDLPVFAPCNDRQVADAALNRLNALWGTDE